MPRRHDRLSRPEWVEDARRDGTPSALYTKAKNGFWMFRIVARLKRQARRSHAILPGGPGAFHGVGPRSLAIPTGLRQPARVDPSPAMATIRYPAALHGAGLLVRKDLGHHLVDVELSATASAVVLLSPVASRSDPFSWSCRIAWGGS
jgi:hypothetical protein